MPDYGHELAFGAFPAPTSSDPRRSVTLARHTEQVGLDLIAFQDHPYLPQFLDTWTLLSYVAAATTRIRLAPCVLNLPLRPPAVLARASASLDLLSGGRLDLGLGAGAAAFRDQIEGMGGAHRTPAESVDALAEAIVILRELWDTSTSAVATHAGVHYQVSGQRGPAPAHPVEIWLGAYQPRMLRLTGRAADGWLPSSSYLPPEGLDAAQAQIDQAAEAAGRSPTRVRRLYNISGQICPRSTGFLSGPVEQWVDELGELALTAGISTFILGTDDPTMITRFATEIAPAVRRLVSSERGDTSKPGGDDVGRAGSA